MRKKGFTLIELLVVIAIIGILVLLATPGVMNASEKAKLAHIKNDVKVVEDELAVYRLSRKEGSELWHLKTVKFQSSKDKKDDITIYSKKGKENEESIAKKSLYDVTFLSDSKLKGKFFANSKGDVFYSEDVKSVDYNSSKIGWNVVYDSYTTGVSSSFSHDEPQIEVIATLGDKESKSGKYALIIQVFDENGLLVDKEISQFSSKEGLGVQEIEFGNLIYSEDREIGASISLNIKEPDRENYKLTIIEKMVYLSGNSDEFEQVEYEVTSDSWPVVTQK